VLAALLPAIDSSQPLLLIQSLADHVFAQV
jgi:hypothetical protein